MPTLKLGQVGGSIPSYGVFTPAGKTLTTQEKQAQNPLYNPLYDPGSTEYQSNLKNTSKGYQTPSVYTKQTEPPPAWQPPAPMPEQDQGQLFQNNNQGGESAVPSWKPPTQQVNAPYGQINPAMGNPIQQRNQPSRYQSPSSRYLRNQGTF